MQSGISPAAAELVAGPAAASPPLTIALLLVSLSLAGPFVFLRDGAGGPLLGVTAIAVALAGMITMLAAARARQRRRADARARRRVRVDEEGVTLYPTPELAAQQRFSWAEITHLHLAPAAFFLEAGPGAARPGRHAVRFGSVLTPRSDILAAIEAFRPAAGEAAPETKKMRNH